MAEKNEEEEFQELKKVCEDMEAYFEAYPKAKYRSTDYFSMYSNSIERTALEFSANKEGIPFKDEDSDLYIKYRILLAKKNILEYRLSKSPMRRNVEDGIKFMASITPQHVSGRIYKIENGDGCGKFCLWFMIIDAIVIFIFYLCTK